MCAHEFTEPRSVESRIEGLLTWLGGGHWPELGERHERSTHAVAGAVVVFSAALAWLVASVAVGGSARLPMLAIVGLSLVFGLLVGAVTRGTASGPRRGWPGTAGRASVAVALGVVVGELAALVMFSGSIEHRLDHGPSAPPIRRRPSRKRRHPSNNHETRALHSTTPSSKPARTRTKRWSSRAANTTPRRPARRPESPACPVPDPKRERQTSFSPTRSMSWTMPWRLAIAKHPN